MELSMFQSVRAQDEVMQTSHCNHGALNLEEGDDRYGQPNRLTTALFLSI
jgi:hypothetical protein